MWTAVEVNVGIICACIPTLKPLILRILPRMLHDHDSPHEDGHINEKSPTHGSRIPPADLRSAQRLPSMAHEACAEIAAKGDGHNDGAGGMDLIEFLTTPEMTELPPSAKCTHARQAGSMFFDFVTAKRPKSMLKMTTKESYFPLAMVTILFFLWGFAYGLLDVLNNQFQEIVNITGPQAMGLHSAYWAGYLIAPLSVGRVVLRKWGFKACFITGLCIYACGTLIFWPSAVLASFPAFLVSNFVVGLGLATLEVAANPFIVLCGPVRYAEARLCLAQGVQAVGSVISPVLAVRVIFRRVMDAPSLIDAQWTYLSIALFDIALAVIFYYLPLPEAS